MSRRYLPVRLSHLIRHCSVGAIVRGPEYLMVVKDIRDWTARDGIPAGLIIRYVEGVRSALNIVQELREPPLARELVNGQVDGACIPAVRFPGWMRCSKCGLLHHKPWKKLTGEGKSRCQADPSNCGNTLELEQVSWVLVHPEGHLADVPWHFLAHKNSATQEQRQCRADWQEPYLRLIDQGSSKLLVCNRCGAKNVFSDSLRVPFGNSTWRQPWIPEPPDETDEMAEVMEINDTRVHSATTRNALVIPPESRIRKGTVVDRLYSSSDKRRRIERAKTSLAREGIKKEIASEFRCSVSEIDDAWREIEKGYPLYGRNITPGILLESEYQALGEEIPDVADDEDFVTQHQTRAWKSKASDLGANTKQYKIVNSLDQVIAVNRLKEIMVFEGFERKVGDACLVPPDIVGKSDWLPALELFGEGIFCTLNEKVLGRWEDHPGLKVRAEEFRKRFAKTGLRFNPEISISARFILLHTLAHLLIRQLEAEAGYPAASLKERIYCTAGKLPMAGILIYVAVPDVAGSLGGLTEQAAPERFLRLLSSVFDHAEWCSLDPVCAEHEGQGPSLLNRAACHACTLIPEPSCAYGNVLLDRTFIRGDDTAEIPAFLDFGK